MSCQNVCMKIVWKFQGFLPRAFDGGPNDKISRLSRHQTTNCDESQFFFSVFRALFPSWKIQMKNCLCRMINAAEWWSGGTTIYARRNGGDINVCLDDIIEHLLSVHTDTQLKKVVVAPGLESWIDILDDSFSTLMLSSINFSHQRTPDRFESNSHSQKCSWSFR